MKTALVLAVHPDDETLGCGGTLLKLQAQGCELHWLIATSVSVEGGYPMEFIHRRNQQIELVSDEYRFASVHQLGLPPARVEASPLGAMVSAIAHVLETTRPDTLFLPFFGDVHSDHRVVFQAAYSCTKSFRAPWIKRIYMMETLSETEFAPAVPGSCFIPATFVDISPYLDKKIEILNIYSSEVHEHPFPRSAENVRALALFRGATAGCAHAESFMLLKEIW